MVSYVPSYYKLHWWSYYDTIWCNKVLYQNVLMAGAFQNMSNILFQIPSFEYINHCLYFNIMISISTFLDGIKTYGVAYYYKDVTTYIWGIILQWNNIPVTHCNESKDIVLFNVYFAWELLLSTLLPWCSWLPTLSLSSLGLTATST